MNDLTHDELKNIGLNYYSLLTLNGLREKGFNEIVINDGIAVIFATDFELTEDNAINFFCNGQKTGEIDLLSLVCIKGNVTDSINIILH